MTKADLSLTHEILAPKNKSENPPLLLLLHGYGSHEQDLFSMAPMLNDDCLVVSARAPLSLPWGGYAWYEIDFDNRGGKMSNILQAKESLSKILNFIEEVQQAYGTNPGKTHLLGFSQGCILSYALALSHPQKFQKIFALSGYILKDIIPEQFKGSELAHLDVFASHGTMDEVLPVEWARNAQKILEKLKISHQYKEYAMGHGVNQQCFDDLQRWMHEREMV